MTMQNVSEVYNAGYQQESVSDRALEAYAEIADELKRMFRPRNAMDVGCGGGALLQGFLDRNVDAYGIEGSEHAAQMHPRIELHDLRNPYPKKTIEFGGYDLVTSFDVGEHIEPECALEFTKTVKKLMGNQGWLVFGAAGEGQDGLGHVNCRQMPYWIDLFERQGLTFFAGLSEDVRAAIAKRENTNFIWWVQRNLLVFKNEGKR